MKIVYFLLIHCLCWPAIAQNTVDLSGFNKTGSAKVKVAGQTVNVSWPVSKTSTGQLTLDLNNSNPLFKSMGISSGKTYTEIGANLDPAFILTVGKRSLSPKSGGWDVFFDRVPNKPHQSYPVSLAKGKARISTVGSRTIIRLPQVKASSFAGDLEITLYNGSPLFNVAAVMATTLDSTAILYDAGLVSRNQLWDNMAWSTTEDKLQTAKPTREQASQNLAVKYRTIIGQSKSGSLAVFPAPHQYFYPLDEAYNLKFTWYGANYRNMIPAFGMGIRQDLQGDRRYVPWFNAPPKTQQRLNFFCLLSTGSPAQALTEVKKFTHNDRYVALPGYKTMQSHFHNEFISNVVLAGKPIPEEPTFVKVFKDMGVNVVHLGEFHGPGHPKGPDSLRLKELSALFEQCKRLSNKNFLLLPGEEANNFYGGHWMSFFPNPVYWVMSRQPNVPFVSQHPTFGKVYHVGNKDEMLQLLELEKGLAWVAHARTKSSTGYPDAYKNEKFFISDTYFGAAWKAIPADLSLPTLSKRVLNLMDDMNNWGLQKHAIAESDIFTIEPENEMYAHLNVNYLLLDKIPDYKDGWQPVLDVMRQGKFFSSTGEVLIPAFTINGKSTGDKLKMGTDGKAAVSFKINWTFPLNYAEIISGDGKQVYRDRINLNTTEAFGSQTITKNLNLKGRTWARLEVWDSAANGAYTQSIYFQ